MQPGNEVHLFYNSRVHTGLYASQICTAPSLIVIFFFIPIPTPQFEKTCATAQKNVVTFLKYEKREKRKHVGKNLKTIYFTFN